MLAALLAGGAAVWLLDGLPLERVLSELGARDGALPDVAAQAAPMAPDASTDVAADGLREPSPGISAELAIPPLSLAPLAESDTQVRTLARERGLASHALARRALEQPDLVTLIARSLLEISEGRSPRGRLLSLAPKRPFEVDRGGESPRIAPESYRRYDPLVDAFVGLDSRTLVRLYRQLEPLFDEAYAQLGVPDGDFDDVLGAAMDMLLAAPAPGEDAPLVPRALRYEFADPALERLPPAQRQLLRMGPRNVERVREKLEELRDLLQATTPPPSPDAEPELAP